MAGNRIAETCFFVQSVSSCSMEQQKGGREAYSLVGDDAELAGGGVAAAADELERRVARGHAAAKDHVRERAAHLFLVPWPRRPLSVSLSISLPRPAVSRPPWMSMSLSSRDLSTARSVPSGQVLGLR